MNRLAPRGASGLKCPECPNPTVSFCLAPRGASGLKFSILAFGLRHRSLAPRGASGLKYQRVKTSKPEMSSGSARS